MDLSPHVTEILSLEYVYGDNETLIGTEPPYEALSKPLQVFLIALYSVTALMALGGNVTAIWVLMVGKRSSKELRIFLVNLAMSDITMALFSIPFTYTDFMLGRWVFHPLFCPFVQFMQMCSVFVSIYTLTAIGIDRWTAKSRGTLTIVLIWMAAIALASVQLIHSKAEKMMYGNNTIYYDCREIWPDDASEKIYTMTVFIITFALPMIILTYTYASIGYKMFMHSTPGNADVVRDEAQLVAKMKVVKMLATVVVLFALCWLPIQTFNLLHWFRVEFIDTSTDAGFHLYNGLFFVCHWLAMANSFVNPVVYCFMSDNFRTDLRNLVKGCCPGLRSRSTSRKMKPAPRSGSYASSFRTTTFITVNNGSGNKKYNQGQSYVRKMVPRSAATELITTDIE
ncbi:putative G-protein coupled receptor 83 [Halotydeus destructor]|nr:putative G-protein coupled receptor 83 [Halotydeus destructor]